MHIKNGQQRIIIEEVQPQVDGGLYPAKRTIGERVDVKANIFGDGHDHIRARVVDLHEQIHAAGDVRLPIGPLGVA